MEKKINKGKKREKSPLNIVFILQNVPVKVACNNFKQETFLR